MRGERERGVLEGSDAGGMDKGVWQRKFCAWFGKKRVKEEVKGQIVIC